MGCVEATRQRNWSRALELCGAAVERGSRGIEALHAANAAFFLGELDRASAFLEKVGPGVDEAGVAQCGGRILEKRGDVAGARERFRKALALHQARGDDSGAAVDATLLARSYLNAGELRAMYGIVQILLRHADSSGDPGHRGFARMLHGDFLLAVGRPDEAVDAFRAARPFFESAGDYRLVSALDMRDAHVRLEQGNVAMARAAYKRARAAADQAGSVLLLRRIALRLALIGVREHDPKVAGQELCRAAELLAEREDPADRTVLHRELAQLALELGDPGSALAALDSAPPPASPEVAWLFSYVRGRAAIRMGREEDALRDFESAVRQIEEWRRSISSKDLTAWFLEDRREPFEELFALQVRRGDLTSAALTMERAQALAFVDAVVSARDSNSPGERAAASAEQLHPAIASLISGRGSNPNAPAELLLPRDEVVLAYFEALGRLWLLRLGRGAPRAFEIAPPLSKLGEMVDSFLMAPDDAAAAVSLGEALLPDGALRPDDAVVRIVPSAALGRVPFSGLRRGARFLVESHAFAYAPSLSALAIPAKRGAAGPPVVLADPSGDLPSARAEGIEIASLLHVAALTGEQATSGALASAREATVLHIAAHAGMAAGGGWLELADRRVSAADILSMRLHPGLAVLASCASGAERGHSMWGGLATAFLAAGTPAVLATLQSVDDASARELVARFYRQGGADDPVRVLAQVQRALAVERPASQWMSFVLLGQVPANGGSTHGEQEGSPGSADASDP